jgi:serine/threonine protein kinase
MSKGVKLFDYDIGMKLGEGSFGEVLLATKNGEKFAIKKISKKQVIKVHNHPRRSINCTSLSSRRRYCIV